MAPGQILFEQIVSTTKILNWCFHFLCLQIFIIFILLYYLPFKNVVCVNIIVVFLSGVVLRGRHINIYIKIPNIK